jgi:hypothetical protein
MFITYSCIVSYTCQSRRIGSILQPCLRIIHITHINGAATMPAKRGRNKPAITSEAPLSDRNFHISLSSSCRQNKQRQMRCQQRLPRPQRGGLLLGVIVRRPD